MLRGGRAGKGGHPKVYLWQDPPPKKKPPQLQPADPPRPPCPVAGSGLALLHPRGRIPPAPRVRPTRRGGWGLRRSNPVLPGYTPPPPARACPVPKGRVQTRPPARAAASSSRREPCPRSLCAAPSPASPAPTTATRRPPPPPPPSMAPAAAPPLPAPPRPSRPRPHRPHPPPRRRSAGRRAGGGCRSLPVGSVASGSGTEKRRVLRMEGREEAGSGPRDHLTDLLLFPRPVPWPASPARSRSPPGAEFGPSRRHPAAVPRASCCPPGHMPQSSRLPVASEPLWARIKLSVPGSPSQFIPAGPGRRQGPGKFFFHARKSRGCQSCSAGS